MESLILYLSCFTISAFFLLMAGKRYSKKEKDISAKLYICISALIPIILSGIRFNVGTDFNTYNNMFFNTKDLSFGELLIDKVEIGHLLIIKIAALFNSVQLMFFIYSFLTILFIYLAILNNKDKFSISLSLFIYLLTFFPSSFNMVRQALSMAIILYSYQFMINRKLAKFIFCALLASTFHIAALVVLPFYFIIPKKEKPNNKIILRVLAIVLMIFIVINFTNMISIITKINLFDKYSIYEKEVESANREVLLKFIIFAFILIFAKKLIEKDETNAIFIYLLIVDLILTFTGDFSPYIKRIALYFGTLRIFVLPAILTTIKNKNERIVVWIGITGYAIAYFVLAYYILGQSAIFPYQTFFIGG